MKDIYNIRNKIRFKSFIEIDPSGCWLWKGTTAKGYGRFYIPEHQQLVAAHRYLWELVNGPIPINYELHHNKCKNKNCVRPSHLRLITHIEHMKLHSLSGIWSGERNSQSKRTDIEVLTIKCLNRDFFLPARYIAKSMNIPERSVYAILSGKSWAATKLPKDLGEV